MLEVGVSRVEEMDILVEDSRFVQLYRFLPHRIRRFAENDMITGTAQHQTEVVGNNKLVFYYQ